jgi:FtsZ-binding cell division protein ZapB
MRGDQAEAEELAQDELAALRAENARLAAAYEETLRQLAAWMEQVNALQARVRALLGQIDALQGQLGVFERYLR